MSLIRLLTTTRSLSDVKNEPSPYRMSEQGLLPKFGPRKKAAARAEAREDRPSPEGSDAAGARPPEAIAGDAKENLGEGHRDRKDAGCSLKTESSRKPSWLAGWWQRLFARKPRRERRGPVQAEFSLNLVQVVRNDLRDADATAGTPEKSKPKLELQPSEKSQAEEESMFGASRG